MHGVESADEEWDFRSHDRRRFTRAPLAVEVSVQSEQLAWVATAADSSCGGVFLRTDVRRPRGTRVVLRSRAAEGFDAMLLWRARIQSRVLTGRRFSLPRRRLGPGGAKARSTLLKSGLNVLLSCGNVGSGCFYGVECVLGSVRRRPVDRCLPAGARPRGAPAPTDACNHYDRNSDVPCSHGPSYSTRVAQQTVPRHLNGRDRSVTLLLPAAGFAAISSIRHR